MGYAQGYTTAVAARLICLAAGETAAANWAAITNAGKFTVIIDGTTYTDLNPDFTGCTTMAQVATAIQTVLNAAITGTTCTWNTNHFEIVSPSVGNGSNISVLMAPTVGTDIAAAAWMNGKQGAVTFQTMERDIADALGDKNDAATTTVGTAATAMAYIKGILNTVLLIGNQQTEVQIYGPAAVDVDNAGHFECTIVDKDVGLVAQANITAGTYTLNRIRAGVTTAISAGAAWSKANGRVYADITFATANWDTDDAFTIVPAGDTTYVVGGTTEYPAIPTISGVIADMGTIEAKIDAIQTDLGDFSARTSLQSLLTTLGVPDVAGKDLYTCLVTDRLDSATYGLNALKTLVDAVNTDLGNYSGQTNLQSLLAALGIPDTAGKPLYTCLVTDRLDNATFGLSANRTALETASLAIGAGSAAANAREGALLRWIADNLPGGATEVETTTLDAGDGSISDHDRAGLIIRWLGDTLNDIHGTDLPAVNTNIGNFAGQANLTTLLAALGIPDVAAKPLYTCLVTDRLDNGTYGLSALNTDLDALLADLGDASASTLGSLYGIVGNPPAGGALYTQIGDAVHLDAAGGSAANKANLSSMIRYLADNAGLRGADGDSLKSLSDQLDTVTTNTALTRAGHTQFKTYAIDLASNTGVATTMFTVDDQTCLVKSITIRSDGATPAHFVSLNVKAGAAGTENTLIPESLATHANLDAASYQVAATGAWVLKDTEIIALNFVNGGGADHFVGTAIVEYMALVDGGHID